VAAFPGRLISSQTRIVREVVSGGELSARPD
jgi:hypothetical protein